MKKSIRTALLLLAMTMLAGCGGPSGEKVEEVQEVYSQLVEKHNKAVELYADIDDDSYDGQLDSMAENLNSIGQQDTKDMTEEEIDAVIVELQDNITMYDEIISSVEQIKKAEKQIYSIPVTINNNTGVKLYQLYLYPVSSEDKGDNLVEDIIYLDGYQTRNIVSMQIEEGNMLWCLEAIDEKGNTIENVEVDFTGYGEDGITVTMEFSFDTMEGWIVLE